MDEIVCSVIDHHLIITVLQVDILAMNRTILVPVAFVLMRMHQLSFTPYTVNIPLTLFITSPMVTLDMGDSLSEGED